MRKLRRPRRTWRSITWSIAASIFAIVVALKLMALGLATSAGHDAYASGDASAADRHFDRAGIVNVIEPWILPRNRGAAAYRGGDLASARDHLQAALEAAPDDEACPVAFDLALTHEAIGDDADAGEARHYRRALAVLRPCTRDAGVAPRVIASIRRLEAKLGQPQKRQQSRHDQQSKAEPPPSGGDGRMRELQRRSVEAARQGQHFQDSDGHEYGDSHERHW